MSDVSTNGTYVCGERIGKKVPIALQHGDIVSLTKPDANGEGKCSYKVIIGDGNPSAAAVAAAVEAPQR